MSAKRTGRVLVVDDDEGIRSFVAESLERDGHDVVTAADGKAALAAAREEPFDVVITDLRMPEVDGMTVVRTLRTEQPDVELVVLTAFGEVATAVEAMKLGVLDYLQKPLQSPRAVRELVMRALDRREGLAVPSTRDTKRSVLTFGAPAMVQVTAALERVAKSNATVLLQGESGTGKEVAARLVHEWSPRKAKPFMAINCAVLTEHLLESELFGHEKGAFTGAVARREGRFEQANNGTIFLDEVSEIPLATQVKLLRFLQERTFERVGGNETLKVDVRVIAATNRDLRQRITAGQFREDLFYRLNVVTLEIPPLRERTSDINELSAFFLGRYADENGKRIEGFSEDALAALRAHSWPGNVRELENAIERAVVLCDGAKIEARHLPVPITPGAQDALPPIPGSTIYDLEKYAILKTLEACKGSTSKAATILGISPRKIQYKLHEYSTGTEGPSLPVFGNRPGDSVRNGGREDEG